VKSSCRVDDLLITYDRSILPGYAWIFPSGNGEYNVGCGQIHPEDGGRQANLKEMLETFKREFPLARELVRGQTECTTPKGAALRCALDGAMPSPQGGLLAIGETVGTTFPFSGEGIGKAMESGEIAAEAVSEAMDAGRIEDLCSFAARLEATLRPKYLSYKKAQAFLSRPWLNDLVFWRANRSRRLRGAFEGIIEETVDPREVFSLAAVAKSFLS
jgi:menaquinone-9 beta-reductase